MPTPNYTLEATIDGRARRLTASVRPRDGGLRIKVFQRRGTATVLACTFVGECLGDRLESYIEVDGVVVGRHTTLR